jgi:hypothetical protein
LGAECKSNMGLLFLIIFFRLSGFDTYMLQEINCENQKKMCVCVCMSRCGSSCLNPSYSGSRDQEDCGSCTCHTSHMEGINRRILVQASLGISKRTYLKNTQSRMGWRCGSSDTVPA